MKLPRLRPDTLITIEYSDDTAFGSSISSKLRNNVHNVFSEIHRIIELKGPVYAVQRSEELLRELRKQRSYLDLFDGNDHNKIKPDILYPEISLIKPVALRLVCINDNRNLSLKFEPMLLPVILDLIQTLCEKCVDDNWLESLQSDVLELYHAIILEMEARNMLVPRDLDSFSYEERNSSILSNCPITFIGHATVLIRSQSARMIIDPWFFPLSKNYPNDYQPIIYSEIGKVDALLITHSHPDHFDPGTLVQFDRKTKIIVPKVERESILAIDMRLRLQELGFENIETMRWWEEKWIEDTQIIALPFHGEQPTNSVRLNSETRNTGNTYLVRTPKFSCAFIADSGRDREGDVRDVALEAYRRWGRIDLLFAGYRGWYLFPIQYVKSSVPWYLLFVPPELYSVRQSIMNGISEAIDTAEIWHAKYLVPYADGGAPWYSEIGLGPKWTANKNKEQIEWSNFDPLPERCSEEMEMRSSPVPNSFAESPVLPLLLKPGQSITLTAHKPKIMESERHDPLSD